MKRKIRLILDSGAFTAWRKGIHTNLNDYIAFIKRYEDCLEGYVNLDVMPGQPGRGHTQDQVEKSAEAGWKNLMRMTKAGLEPMPVFHLGESWEWLDRLVAEFPYIGIGGAATLSDTARRPWLDEVFERLCGRGGYPPVKVHGFGITAVPLIHRYPWYSVDSVTWMVAGGNGSIYVPKWDHELSAYDYRQTPHVISCSRRKDGKAINQNGIDHHLDALGPTLRRYVHEYLEAGGFDLDLVRDSYKERDRVNVRFFLRVSDAQEHRPFRVRQQGLFHKGHGGAGHDVPPEDFRFIFSININPEFTAILRRENVRDILITYFWYRDECGGDLREFIRTGVLPPRRAENRKLHHAKTSR